MSGETYRDRSRPGSAKARSGPGAILVLLGCNGRRIDQGFKEPVSDGGSNDWPLLASALGGLKMSLPLLRR